MTHEMKELGKAIKGLTAIQTRMALILLSTNGKKSALKFIQQVENDRDSNLKRNPKII